LFTRGFIQPNQNGHAWRNAHFQSDFECEAINLGAAGVMLGLISVDQAFGRRSFDNDISRGADWLVSRGPDQNSLGLFTGDAGVALALGVASKRLSRPDLLIAAKSRLSMAASVSTELDLFCGAAGVLWAGCLLAEVLQDRWPLDVVRKTVQLLVNSVDVRQDVVVWPASPALDESDAPYTGAAHGSAGIAMALAIWARRSSDHDTLQLAARTFISLHALADSENRKTFPRRIGVDYEPAPIFGWCHGVGGVLWSLLLGFGDDPKLQREIDWAVDILTSAPSVSVDSPTYCHGLAGHLELWRMLSAVPRYRNLALKRARLAASALRLLFQRSNGRSMWSSEEPKIVTPDLWIGFLGPATALALYAIDSEVALLSGAWLKSCTFENNHESSSSRST
jgi:lantibiotic modifying enzyme